MFRTLQRISRDERGTSLVVATVMLLGVLSVLALAIDLAMLFTARGEAQRAADSTALAGASIYLHPDTDIYTSGAKERAKEYAANNHVRNRLIDTTTVFDAGNVYRGEDVMVEVLVSERKVRATVWSQPIGLWFARLFGRQLATVSAVAVAEAADASSSNACVKPFAIPDRDANGDPFTLASTGQQIKLKMAQTDDDDSDVESFYFPITLPYTDQFPPVVDDEPQWGCPMGTGDRVMWDDPCEDGDPREGACWYRLHLCRPNCMDLSTGVEYAVEPGNMTGPTAMGVNSLITREPGYYWDTDCNCIYGPDGPVLDPHSLAHRVITVPLYDPLDYTEPGRQYMEFTGFALFFLEDGPKRWGGFNDVYHPDGHDPIVGRFMMFAAGSGAGGNVSEFTRYLRLVE